MTTLYSSMSVARETGFGSLNAMTGDVDASGLTYLATRAERIDVITFGEMPANADERGRSGPHEYPAWPETSYDATPQRRHRRTGAITFTIPWYGFGTRTATPANHPLAMIFGSSMADSDAPTVTSDTVTGISGTQLTPATTGTDYRTGDLIGVNVAGTYEVAGITEATTGPDLLKVSPSLSAVLAGGTAVRSMRTFYLANDLGTGTAAERAAASSQRPNSLALKLDGIDQDRQAVRTYAVAGRLQSARLSMRGRLAVWEIVIFSPFIYDDHSNGAPVDAPAHDGPALHLLNSSVLVSAAVTDTAPEELARTALSVDAEGVEFSIEWELVQLGETSNALGCRDIEPTNPQARLVLPLSAYQTSSDRDMLDRVRRGAMLTLAPGHFQGAGGAIYFPSGVQQRDTFLRPQVLEFAQGRSQGDVAGGPAANSSVRIGLGL